MTMYKRYASLIFIVVFGVLFQGCASLSKEECLNADWYAIGFSDGTKGYHVNRQDRHRKACAEHRVQLDIDRYMDGREKGLRQYCRPATGYRQGLSGRRYNGVCPASLEEEFLHAHRYGKRIHYLRAEIKRGHNEIHRFDADLQSNKKHLRKKELRLVADGVSRQARIQILYDIKKLRKERRIFKQQIREQQLQLDDLEAELHDRQQRNPYR